MSRPGGAARRFALTSTFGAIVTLIVFRRSEFFFLAHYSKDSEIALYSIAFAASSVLAALPDRLGGVMASAFASLFGAGDRLAIRAGYARSQRMLIFLAMVLTAFAAALGPAAITVFYGSRYDGAHQVLLVLLIGVPFAPMWSTGTSLLTGVADARRPLLIGVFAAVINVALAFMLVPAYDAVGAAAANSGAQVCSALAMAAAARRAGGKIRWQAGTAVRGLVVAGGCGAAAWGATTIGGLPGLIAGGMAGVLAFAILARLLRPLEHSDAQWLLEALGDRMHGRAADLVRAIARNPSGTRLPRHLAVFSDARILGGAEISLGHLLTHLDPSVHVTVVGVDADVVEALAARRPGSGRLIVDDVEMKLQVRRMVRMLLALRRLHADILQVTLPTPWACRYLLILAPLVPGLRVIAVEQLPTPPPDGRARRIKRYTTVRLDGHVSVGAAAARLVEQAAGLSDRSIGVIYNGVEPRTHGTTRTPGHGNLIGTVARLAPQKGIDDLLRALVLLPGVRAEIVGDGPERETLMAMAARLGVADRVAFAGWQDPAGYLARWDVFVLASHYEGFPLAIVEALFSGPAVVATDVGSVSEVIEDGCTGLLVAPEDPGSLAVAVRRALADPDLRDRLATAGRRVAEERFSAARMASAYEFLYAQVLEH